MNSLLFPRQDFYCPTQGPAQGELGDRPHSNAVPLPFDPQRLPCMSLSDFLGLALCFLELPLFPQQLMWYCRLVWLCAGG